MVNKKKLIEQNLLENLIKAGIARDLIHQARCCLPTEKTEQMKQFAKTLKDQEESLDLAMAVFGKYIESISD